MYNKTVIEFGFCDVRNNQGRGKCVTLVSTLIIPDITKTEFNYCLKLDDCEAGVQFVNYEYDYRRNWTTQCPFTN